MSSFTLCQQANLCIFQKDKKEQSWNCFTEQKKEVQKFMCNGYRSAVTQLRWHDEKVQGGSSHSVKKSSHWGMAEGKEVLTTTLETAPEQADRTQTLGCVGWIYWPEWFFFFKHHESLGTMECITVESSRAETKTKGTARINNWG